MNYTKDSIILIIATNDIILTHRMVNFVASNRQERRYNNKIYR